MVQAHGHVGPERLLDRRGPLGRQLEQPAVEVRPEGHALVGDPVPLGQAEDLEAARVGEDRPVPAHERVQAAERGHHLLTRPKRQVIGVGQEHPRAGRSELVGRQPLDRRLRADRHERRRLDRPVRRLQQAGSRAEPASCASVVNVTGRRARDRTARIARTMA